ncbi:deoxyribodipyrimidine photo-lyase [uncultured Roseovarius sp.]|uniref:cryptochrome/photolyase family protein n=1 Tax=uncultured Roseovarius sp. TaxID=293344 RepID=UPI0026279B07|nr:deoxyribodipyrimidine photo-lyase [uncultured Roseovarius sp.]
MSERKPTLLWLRRDLRLGDHPALLAACANEAPVIPVFICDEAVDRLGAAPKWRLSLSLNVLSETLEAKGSRLILRRGNAQDVLDQLIEETGAGAVYWSRLYDPDAIERDTAIKTSLKERGVDAQSFNGHLLFEPWSVETKQGGFYRVYTPMWNAVKDRDVPTPDAAPKEISAPAQWPDSDALSDWHLGAAMHRGAAVVSSWQRPGEASARDRLAWFTYEGIEAYRDARNMVGVDGTSGMSDYLALGEISPRECWHAGLGALHHGAKGAETWLKELVWREFAYHLMYHTPHILTRNWREEWEGFPWRRDENQADVLAWKQGRTGMPFVDAAMREMYVTGRMHNRARMIVASYLTKHLLTHWQIGQRWFEECLTDWDPASNAMGWQWTAGSGPDASPYFRIFNPETQLEKFDPDGAYVARWIAEGEQTPERTALAYFDAVPKSWNMSPKDAYPQPVVELPAGRNRALAAYQARDG